MTEINSETNSLSVKYGFYEKLKKALKISSFAGWVLLIFSFTFIFYHLYILMFCSYLCVCF